MDRPIIYPGQIPLETDLLSTNQNAMIALSKLAAAILGTSTIANGFACVPTTPASMNVQVGAGEIYALANLEATAYSSLDADTTHSILKQGIRLDASNLACAAPGTGGHSINYLIQAAFSEVDGTPIVLPYYNASNPSTAYAGPENTGVAENTIRSGTVVVSAKAGTSALTGAQTTPAPDAGYVGLWVVTVANGATTITAPDIAAEASAPIIANTLNLLAPKASPTFTGVPAAPTAAPGTDTTQLATTAFVEAARVILVAASALKANIASPTLTGTPAAPTAAVGTNTTQLATCAFAIAEVANQFTKAGQQSLATSGYQKLPGGLIIQWGTGSFAAQTGAITFPVAFPTACIFAIPVDDGTVGSINGTTNGKTTTQATFEFNAIPNQFEWMSLGY